MIRALVDAIASWLHGPRCVICGERSQLMVAHVYANHAGDRDA